ncbi:MAG: hypothetical protein LH606_20355, partial [Cytophagaceae bacterium]|nr:hypothetical protein [Cytophagaceae bacterium]
RIKTDVTQASKKCTRILVIASIAKQSAAVDHSRKAGTSSILARFGRLLRDVRNDEFRRRTASLCVTSVKRSVV